MNDPSNLDGDSGPEGGEAERGEGDDDSNGDEAEADNPPTEQPQTKSQLQQLRERFANTMKLVSHLLHDVSLRDDFRLVHTACYPYMLEYSETLEAQKKSQVT